MSHETPPPMPWILSPSDLEKHGQSSPPSDGGPSGPSVLEEASSIVSGSRQESYGDPSGNHETTALMWHAYLARRQEAAGADTALEIDGVDTCVFNLLQKVSRFAWQRKRDNLVDIAGYVRCIEMLLD